MIVVSRSVHINAPVARIFALMANPLARARLNPHNELIGAEIEGGGALKLGSVCRFRLRADGHILDYRTVVCEYEPNRLIVSLSDSAIPFEVRIETEPANGGVRLTQTETFGPSDEMLRQALPDNNSNAILRAALSIYMFLDADAALKLRQRQEGMLTKILEKRMDAWLGSIKKHLETGGRNQDSRRSL
jgi:hypothetical protein